MPLPAFTKKPIETRRNVCCDRRIFLPARDELKMIFNIKTDKWTLYCMDRNSRWRLYGLVKPSIDFDDMLEALDHDRKGIFWG